MKKTLSRIVISVFIFVLWVGTFSNVFAANTGLRYEQAGSASGSISYAAQNFTVTINGVTAVKQINATAVLYEKGFFGDTQVGTLSVSSPSSVCYGEKSCTIKAGKSYRLEITSSAYLNGVWEPITQTINASF